MKTTYQRGQFVSECAQLAALVRVQVHGGDEAADWVVANGGDAGVRH